MLILHPEHLLTQVWCSQLFFVHLSCAWQVYGEEDRHLEACNPLSGEVIPIVVTAEVEYPHGSQAILAMPSAVEEHKHMVEKLGRSVTKDVLSLGPKGEVTLKNSGSLSGKTIESAREAVLAQARIEGWGGHLSSPHLQDWLVSRQRYWGAPIPVVHCQTCGTQPLHSSSLPVALPDLDPDMMHGRGKSPLLQVSIELVCPLPQIKSLGDLAEFVFF